MKEMKNNLTFRAKCTGRYLWKNLLNKPFVTSILNFLLNRHVMDFSTVQRQTQQHTIKNLVIYESNYLIECCCGFYVHAF